MTDKAGTKRTPPEGDRRSGKDRRKADRGPPGKIERRRSVEQRAPEVVEREMSNSEWGALQTQPQPLRK
jgi:hypothetical protein